MRTLFTLLIVLIMLLAVASTPPSPDPIAAAGTRTLRPTRTATRTATPRASATPGVVCRNINATCSQLRSCEEAKACWLAGNDKLDRDDDGVPCESLCGS